jgi:hypothetical protein
MFPHNVFFRSVTMAALGLLSTVSGAEGEAPSSTDQSLSPPPIGVRDPQVGICTHFAFPGNGWPTDTMAPLIARSGAGWIRDDLFWSSIEKSPGVYQIPQHTLDWINAVSATGVKIDLVFNYGNKIYPDKYDPEAYAKAAAWTAAQLAGKIQAIEIMNEPANFGYSTYYDSEQAWSGLKKDATVATYVGKYVTLLNTAAKAIRAANPSIKIIGLGCSPGANFHALTLGIVPEVDGITDHPYSPRSEPERVPFAATPGMLKRDGILTADEKGTFASQIRMYREQSAKYHGPKELWLTEQGWSTFTGFKPFSMFAPVTENVQARYILRRLCESQGLGVAACFIYDLRDDGADPGNNEHHFGLLNRNSMPKPSYLAVQRFCAAMANFRPKNSFPIKVTPDGVPDTQLDDSVRTYQFADSKGTPLIALWDAKPDDGKFNPPDANVEIETDTAISKISVYDPLSGETGNVPFQATAGRVVLKNLKLPDSPILLTLTMSAAAR